MQNQVVNRLLPVSALLLALAILLAVYLAKVARGESPITDWLIKRLEWIHQKTAPQEDIEIEEYSLSDKVKVRKVYFPEENEQSTQKATVRREPND